MYEWLCQFLCDKDGRTGGFWVGRVALEKETTRRFHTFAKALSFHLF